jgi:hypothetical protein
LTPSRDPLAHHRTVVRIALDALPRLGHRLPDRVPQLVELFFGDGPGPNWRSTVQAQMQLTGQDREQAEAALLAALNQLGALVFKTTWFDEDPVKQTAAIEETLRYVSGRDRQVRSRAAQEAWLEHWELQQHPPPDLIPKRPRMPGSHPTDQPGEMTIGPASPEIMAYVRQLNRTEAQCLEAWTRWASPSTDDR